MNHKQRLELLRKIDTGDNLADHVSMASLSGAGALAVLSMTVHFTGFAFYTTLSTLISVSAGFFGVTLPFAAYTATSSTVAFLSGPVGWAILAIAGAAGITLAGRANPQKTAAAICQIHALKIAALEAAGKTDPAILKIDCEKDKKSLVGQWRIKGHREIITLKLGYDGTFTAECRRVPAIKGQERKFLWTGKGNWKVNEKKLSVKRTHTKAWAGYWTGNKRKLYDQREIIEVTPTIVKLANKAEMKRL